MKVLIFLFLAFSLLYCQGQHQTESETDKIYDLSYFKDDPDFLSYFWDPVKMKGAGVMNNGYVVQTKSWNNESEFGLETVNLTTSAKIDFTGYKEKEKPYKDYIESEIIKLAKTQLRDPIAIKAIEEEIRNNKGEFKPDVGTYYLLADEEEYTEISVLVVHLGFYTHVITIFCRGVY